MIEELNRDALMNVLLVLNLWFI